MTESPPLTRFRLRAATQQVRFDEPSDLDPPRLSDGDPTTDLIYPVVRISPAEVAIRRTVTGHGMAAESVQSASRNKIQYRFRAPLHLLVMYEKGERRDGETFVEGLPRSTLRNLERKLTFVPAGHEYHEWHEPRGHTRIMLFYFDPAKLKFDLELAMPDISLGPRLLFEDATLWHTALKLKTLVESLALGDRLYFEALGSLLVHELAWGKAGSGQSRNHAMRGCRDEPVLGLRLHLGCSHERRRVRTVRDRHLLAPGARRPTRTRAPIGQRLVAHAHGARRGVRRYRHEPPLYLLRRARRRRPGPAGGRQRVRHRLVDPLGAAGDGVAQIRRVRASRRQRRRGRDPGAAVAGGARSPRRRRQVFGPGFARSYGSGAALRRRRHHAGDFRAVGDGGAQAGHARIRGLRAAGDDRDPDRPVRDPAAWHREHRRTVWSGHDRLVRGPRHSRLRQYLGRAGHSRGARSGPGDSLHCDKSAGRIHRDGRGVPGADRRRGALCRHGPCRSFRHPTGLVRLGAAGAAAELFRSGCAGARRSHSDRQPILQVGAGLGAYPDGGAGGGRDHHRLAGADIRRLLPDPAGDPDGALPAHADRADVAQGSRDRKSTRLN